MKPRDWRLLGVLLTTASVACSPSDAGPGGESALPRESPAVAVDQVQPDLEAYGQIIYVPAYSHIYHVRRDRDFQLTVTLSVRNPFPWRSVTILRVDYFDSSGRFIRGYLDGPTVLGPLETLEVVVAEDDESGGSGANFLIGWEGMDGEAGPMAEAVMIGTSSGQGLSFSSRGFPVPRE